MNIIITASRALRKWMNLDLPYMQQKNGNSIGAQSITTNANQVSWQCHVTESKRDPSKPFYTVIAVEPHSKYALLIPYLSAPSKEQLSADLVYRWGNESLHRLVDSGSILKTEAGDVAEQFKSANRSIYWFMNTDVEAYDRCNNAATQVEQYLEAQNLEYLVEDHAIDLGARINGGMIEDNDESFVPINRFVEDGLFRFAKGMSQENYDNTPAGDYPAPWSDQEDEPSIPKDQTGMNADNIISIESFLKR